MKTIEADDQAAIFRWAEAHATYHRPNIPELALLNGSLNGVRLTIGQSVKAKKQGLRKGYPDLFLPVPRGGYHGLFIELKIKPYRNEKNKMVYPKTSDDQRWWKQELTRQGYRSVILEGLDAAQIEILNYLKLKR